MKKIIAIALILCMALAGTAFATDAPQSSDYTLGPAFIDGRVYGSYFKEDTFTDAVIRYDPEAEYNYLYVYTTYRGAELCYFAGPFEFISDNIYRSYSNDEGVMLVTYAEDGSIFIDTSLYTGMDPDIIAGQYKKYY